MNIDELNSFAYNTLRDYWGVTDCCLPSIERKNFSSKNKLGQFECLTKNVGSDLCIFEPKIYISSNVLDFGSNFFCKEVLKHELCHYAMILKKLPFRDGDPFFESELERVGAFSSKNVKTYFVVTCNECISRVIFSFPEKSKAKTFCKEQCVCGGKNKNLSFFFDDDENTSFNFIKENNKTSF